MPKNVHTISFLITNTDEVLKQAQDSQEPVMILVNGRVKVVVQDVLSYQKTQDQLSMLRILAFGPKQAKKNTVANPASIKGPTRRTGFLTGQMVIPDDFDQMGSTNIERLFNGDS